MTNDKDVREYEEEHIGYRSTYFRYVDFMCIIETYYFRRATQEYESGVSSQKESPQLPLPKATTCFTHHVTDSATYMQCF